MNGKFGALVCLGGALLTFGCGSSSAEPAEESSVVRQSVVSGATETLTLALDPMVPLGEVAFASTEGIRVGGRTQMASPGGGSGHLVNTGTGSIHVQSDAQAFGLRSRGTVLLDDRSRVEGDVVASGSVTQGNQVVVSGSVEADALLQHPGLVQTNVEFPGGDDVLRDPDTPAVTLTPGAYGDVTLRSRSTVVLGADPVGGDLWHLESLTVEPEAVLRVETTPGKPTVIYVRERFDFKGTFELDGSPEDLFIALATSEPVSIERQIDGTIFAPNAALRLAPAHRTFTGAIWAKSLEIEPDLTLQFVPFGHWDRIYPQLFMIPGDRPGLPNELAKSRVPPPGSPLAGAPAGQSTFRMLDPSGYVPSSAPTALNVTDPEFRVRFTRIRVGADGCGSSTEPSLVNLHVNGVAFPTRHLPDCPEHSWCNIDVELSTPVPPDQQVVAATATIRERDGGTCGPDNDEWSVSFRTDNWDGHMISGEARRLRDNEGRDFFGPLPAGEVCHGFRDWGLCWEAEITGPPKPDVEDVEIPVCAGFVSEYLDSGYGEDRMIPGVVEPARFAWGKLVIDSQVRYEGFLDEHGCVPEAHQPRRPELVHDASRTDFITFEYKPTFCLRSDTATTDTECAAQAEAARDAEPDREDGDTERDIAVKRLALRAAGPVSWEIYTVDPAFLSAKVESGVRAPHVLDSDTKNANTSMHRFHGVVHPGGFWLEQHGYRYPDPDASVVALWEDPADERKRITSRVAAASTVLLDTPDNGILADRYALMANDSCPTDVFDQIGDACVDWGRVWIGPGRDNLEGRSPYDQSFWKGVVLHEIGHLVELKAIAQRPGFSGMYAFTDAGDPSQSRDLSMVHPDPPGTPDMCACAQVEESNKLHCMQSLERYGEAHGEGFAQFYAARALNTHGQNDCIFPYYKETLLETCASGDCDPWADGPLQNNKPPVPFDCIEPVQWRNLHCPLLADGRTNEDRSTEVDWMKFLYSLNTQADHKWSMIDLWGLYDTVRSHAAECDGNESGVFCWGSVIAAGDDIGSVEQAREVREQGLAYGIDENLGIGDAP